MIAVRSAHLMPEVMDCQNRASTLIYTSRPILCSQVDRDQGCMPVIGNEHEVVVAIGCPATGHQTGRLQRRFAQQRTPAAPARAPSTAAMLCVYLGLLIVAPARQLCHQQHLNRACYVTIRPKDSCTSDFINNSWPEVKKGRQERTGTEWTGGRRHRCRPACPGSRHGL